MVAMSVSEGNRNFSGLVGVNLLWLDPGVVGGSEEYTIRLLRAMDSVGVDELHLRLYVQPQLVEAYPDLVDRFECVVSPRFGSKGSRIAAEHSWLARHCGDDDVVHHAGGTVPAIRLTPTIVTIHDLQPIEHPQHFSLLKRRWLTSRIPRSAAASRAVVCPSKFTANRVNQLLGVDPGRIQVVHHGHEAVIPGVADSAIDRELKESFGRYMLYPAITYEHKRHCDVIAALDLLRDRFDDLQVVFTGRAGPQTEALITQARRLNLSSRVHHLGRVTERRLDSLYRSAAATVFPSSYEGFGNPALEAMVRGCPVVVSDAGALPEVVGDAGVVVPVGDVSGFAEAVSKVLSDSDFTSKLRASGVNQGATFSWETAGSALLQVYHQSTNNYVRPSSLSNNVS